MGEEWSPKLKYYPHFDAPISVAAAEALVSDQNAVARNKFYPFLRYEQRWQPFRLRSGRKTDKKIRPIRFASRRDSYIYSYYRNILSIEYENILIDENLSDAVIAYRRIRQANGVGKSNIEFAHDAFEFIGDLGDCVAVALDISSFFESLDHALLKKQWLRLLGLTTLPADHSAIFRSITRYAVADLEEVYLRLGYKKVTISYGITRVDFVSPRGSIPTKICSNKDFREKICGYSAHYSSLIDVNQKPYGIPQGSPISDLLANIYMIDFDIAVNRFCVERGGKYFRYSDDIMIVLPGGEAEALCAKDFAFHEIKRHGKKLTIKEKKTSAIVYEKHRHRQAFRLVAGLQGKNGLEYLGFRYDGCEYWLRDATLARLYRSISKIIYVECKILISRYRGKNKAFLVKKFDYINFFQRYGKVEEFSNTSDYTEWTF